MTEKIIVATEKEVDKMPCETSKRKGKKRKGPSIGGSDGGATDLVVNELGKTTLNSCAECEKSHSQDIVGDRALQGGVQAGTPPEGQAEDGKVAGNSSGKIVDPSQIEGGLGIQYEALKFSMFDMFSWHSY